MKLWHVRIPTKVRMFTWRLAKMSIAIGEVRAHRNMATDDTCPICNAVVDTWGHALIECKMSRAVWALADVEVVEHLIMNRTNDAQLWIFWLVDTMKENELAMTLVTHWAIWWARRRDIHAIHMMFLVPLWSESSHLAVR